MDLSTFTTALGGIKTATDIAKAIKEADYSLETAELKLKLADIVTALADAKLSIVEIQELLQDRDLEIRLLKTQLKQGSSLVYEAPYYWKIDSNKEREGPYCQSCYDSEEKLIRIIEKPQGRWTCNICKAIVDDATYTYPMPQVIKQRRSSRWADGL